MRDRIDGARLLRIREAITDFLFDSVKLSGAMAAELFKDPVGGGKTSDDTNMFLSGRVGISEQFIVRGLGADIFYDRFSPPTIRDFRNFQEAVNGSWTFVINSKSYYRGSLKSVTDLDIAIKDDKFASMKQTPVPLRIPEKMFILEEPFCLIGGHVFSAELSWPSPLSPDNPFKLYFYLLGTRERDVC